MKGAVQLKKSFNAYLMLLLELLRYKYMVRCFALDAKVPQDTDENN